MKSRWIYGGAVLGALAALAYTVRPVLSPFVLFLLVLFLLAPLDEDQTRARLAVAATALLILWILHVTGLLLAPFLLALILAYILDPVVGWLHGHGVPRPAGIALLALPLLGIAALGVLVVAPALGHQLSQFIANVPSYVGAVEGWLRGARAWLLDLRIAGVTEETIPRLQDFDAETVGRYLERWRIELAAAGTGAVLGLGRGVGTVLTILGYVVLTPILTYFLLRDWPRVRERLVELVPPDRREPVLQFSGEFDHLLARYLRGQFLLAVVVGLVVGLGFWLVDFPYPLLLGLIAGVLNLVPYLGFAASTVVAVVIALFSGAVLASLLKIALVMGVEQVVEGVLGPKIVGDSVGLHPVWVILALALFSFFFGFVGLLIAVPAAVFLKLVAVHLARRYRDSEFYRAEAGGASPS